ncbi:hypothetical protein BH23ACT9_BH23ACT9_02240 [soil metagenome]
MTDLTCPLGARMRTAARLTAALLAVITLLAAIGAAPASSQPGPAAAVIELPPTTQPVALSIDLSRRAGSSAGTVLLGTSGDFPDSLASGGLQGLGRPLLLTPGAALDPDARGEIERLGATSVEVLGGTAAISEAVVDELQAAGLQVTRVAGPTRVETAVTVADRLPAPDRAFVVRAYPREEASQGFADSLAVGAWAAEVGGAVLLTTEESLSTATGDWLEGAGLDAVEVIGGTAAIAPRVEADLQAIGLATSRVAGDTRGETAVAVAEARGLASPADTDTVVLLDGTDPLAWTAGFGVAGLAADLGAPVLLSDGPALPDATVGWFAGGAAAEDATTILCAAPLAACQDAAARFGGAAVVTLSQAAEGRVVHHGSPLTGTAPPGRTLIFTGDCLPEGSTTVMADEDGGFTLAVAASGEAPAADTTCVLDWTVSDAAGGDLAGTFTLTLDVIEVALQRSHPLGVALGEEVRGTLDDPGIGDIGVAGCGLAATVDVGQGTFATPRLLDPGILQPGATGCGLTLTIEFPDGGLQVATPFVDTYCAGGQVAEIRQDGYALYDGQADLYEILVSPTDRFEIGGQPAGVADFLASLIPGSCLTPPRPQDQDPSHEVFPIDLCDFPDVDARAVFGVSTVQGTYDYPADGGGSSTIDYRTGTYADHAGNPLTLEQFEALLAPGVCIAYTPPTQTPSNPNIPAHHQLLGIVLLPGTSFRG